jgi:ribosome-associated toxin RatA of RatAB toxin-antitoxin module
MIKKMTSLRAPVDQVQKVLQDIESWPHWMPYVTRARVLESSADSARVEMTTVMLGKTLDQTVEFRQQPGRVTQKQIAGLLKRWDSEWRFWSDKENNATVLSAAFDIDLGYLGLFVPERTVANAINDWFSQLSVKAEERIRKLALQRPTASPPSPSPDNSAPAPSDETLLQVFQTTDGLEVWIQRQRFFIPASP